MMNPPSSSLFFFHNPPTSQQSARSLSCLTRVSLQSVNQHNHAPNSTCGRSRSFPPRTKCQTKGKKKTGRNICGRLEVVHSYLQPASLRRERERDRRQALARVKRRHVGGLQEREGDLKNLPLMEECVMRVFYSALLK